MRNFRWNFVDKLCLASTFASRARGELAVFLVLSINLYWPKKDINCDFAFRCVRLAFAEKLPNGNVTKVRDEADTDGTDGGDPEKSTHRNIG